MTDTQIIIDEIDVTSCIYACHKLNKDGLHDCRIPNTAPFCCENIRNCYYKKLKRKEQECVELRGVIRKDICSHYVLGECSQKHHNNCVGRNQCIKDLEQECEELKDLNTRLDNQREAYWKEYQKLKATLTEIKFWARELLKRTGQVVPYEIKQILQKISECEVENEKV